jgi:hypothetical protein
MYSVLIFIVLISSTMLWQGKLNILDSSTEHTIASFLHVSGAM